MATPLLHRGLPGGGGSTSHGRSRPATPQCCNRCRKPLMTTVFIVSCDCVFCEDCAMAHFQNNTTCPKCRKPITSEADFTELVVSDPSPSSEDTTKSNFQSMFTKRSRSAQYLGQEEMCRRLLRAMDDNKRLARFLLKQVVMTANSSDARSGEDRRHTEQLEAEYTQFKQAANSQRIQSEQTIADLQNRLQAQGKALAEKDSQLRRLQEIVVAEGIGQITSSHSHSSGGKRGPSAPLAQPPSQRQRSAHQAPPVAMASGHPAMNHVVPMHRDQRIHRTISSADSLVTPIQSRPGSANSFGLAPLTAGSGRPRDYQASSSGYSFARGRHYQQPHSSSNNPRDQPISPSNAFAMRRSQSYGSNYSSVGRR